MKDCLVVAECRRKPLVAGGEELVEVGDGVEALQAVGLDLVLVLLHRPVKEMTFRLTD